jgi:nucleotidyltransferase/DNA polymerase involved in DNA repair
MKEVKNSQKSQQIHVHIDADAFFASVEQVLHRELQGKAIVVGQNGGIVSALSYQAKAMSIPRVMPIVTVRRQFPSVDIVSSDFYAYGIFSARMERIICEYLPNLVKNSVDECSSHIGNYVTSFEEARKFTMKIQSVLYEKLGCRFSFGIARTPLLAKLASGMNKPNGITVLNDENIRDAIYTLPISSVSGIGKKSFEKLQRYGIHTIGDFVMCDENWLRSIFSIAVPDIQRQLLGIITTIPTKRASQKSMSRDRSFSLTNRYEYLYSQISMNIEYLSHRMRKDGVVAKRIGIRLRNRDLSFTNALVTLPAPSRDPGILIGQAKSLLESIYVENVMYGQVSVTCSGLQEIIQYDLFGEIKEPGSQVLDMIDTLEYRFGKSCIGLASSMTAQDDLVEVSSRRTIGDTYPHPLLPGEEVRKRLRYPFLGIVK